MCGKQWLDQMDYGSEVWWTNSKQEDKLESVQIQTVGKWFGCSGKTTREAVRGDMGLESLKVRRDMGKLKEWGRMSVMEDDRLESMAWKLKVKFLGVTRSWDSLVGELIRKYRLVEEAEKLVLEGGKLGEWMSAVEVAVKAGSEEEWWDGVNRHSKLRRYASVKGGRWGMEKWMYGKWTLEKKVKFRWRTGSSGLMEDMGRREGSSKECRVCEKGVDETVEHVLWECDGYGEVREEFMRVLEMEAVKLGETTWWERFGGESVEERTRIMLGGEVKGGIGGVGDANSVSLICDTIGSQFIVKIHKHRVNLVHGPASFYPKLCGGDQGLTAKFTVPASS